MTAEASRGSARDPQDLDRLLIERQWAGDGMAALFEPHAVLESGTGRLTAGRDAIRAFFADFVASGWKFQKGIQSPTVVSGDLALTSTHLPMAASPPRWRAGKATEHGYGSSIATR